MKELLIIETQNSIKFLKVTEYMIW